MQSEEDEMTAELDALKKILDSKTPLRHGGAGKGVLGSTAAGYDGSPGGGSGILLGGERIPPHLDVNSIMKRFNSAGPSGSPRGGAHAFGLGMSGDLSTPAEEITSALKSYDDAVAGAEVREEGKFDILRPRVAPAPPQKSKCRTNFGGKYRDERISIP